ncbi:MAG: homocysteine biosynthesis protein [candidate division WOR-3 bacterium]|uniref:Homocysteine biosynthesis enzyme sulfur-incorporation domain-containing protein n=1 Tax=candidate division WOR-3 bacterium TaxID=2052148 RepID=A0A7V3ZTM4_UNCW3
MKKSIEEINERIKKGEAVVLRADEVVEMGKKEGFKEIFKKVDVVTTGTFGMMCSSGAFINTGHFDPPTKLQDVTLNDVKAYGGLAAVDIYIGATERANGREDYGGAHVIEELVKGEKVRLKAKSIPTDCYPGKEIDVYISLKNINQAFLFNPRNCYQNYYAVTNSSNELLYTYMGLLLPNFGNVAFSTSGEISPLHKDPYLRTIGIGTKVFLAGAQGYVVWEGTQFNSKVERNKETGIPKSPSGTLALIGNLKEIDPEFLKAAYIKGYGISLFIGVGIPIPVLDEDMAFYVSIPNEKIKTKIIDYGIKKLERPFIKEVNYAQLFSGWVDIKGKKVKTQPRTSIYKSKRIAEILKKWILKKKFYLTEPVKSLPLEGVFKPWREI